MKLGKYRIRVRLNARRSWLDPIYVYNREFDLRHFVVGSLSILIENVSDELYSVCAICGSDEAHEEWAGDEGLTVCNDCGAIEGGYEYVSLDELESA